ncbi:MAG: tripartite tricarboxylate transporter substrate binding protein [Bacillota bacterium]|nr:tripartite tricarboxylate transporter substrate binding protein [Bacillota bacterium]
MNQANHEFFKGDIFVYHNMSVEELNMKRSIWIFFLLLLVIGFLFITGCDGTTPAIDDEAEPEETAQEEEPEEDEWTPEGAILFIVPKGAGGGYDVYARGIAPYMEKYLGVPVIVENEPAGDGLYGVQLAYEADPDGYTIVMLDIGQIVAYELVEEQAYVTRDFELLAQMATYNVAIFTGADSPYNTLDDLKAADNIIVGASGSPQRNEVIPFTALDLEVSYVSGYDGTADVMVALARGDVDLTVSPDTTGLDYVLSGDVRPLIFLGTEPSEAFENSGIDCPTAAELGYPELGSLVGPRIIAAPPGTPEHITSVLEDAILKSMADPDFLAWADEAGRPMHPVSSEGCGEIVQGMFNLFTPYTELLREYMTR